MSPLTSKYNSNNANLSYKFAFNGKMQDNEVYGEGNAYDFGARIYDGRLGKFLSIDRYCKDSPSQSNYTFAGNSPIHFLDINGDFQWPEGVEGQRLAEAYPTAYKYIMSLDNSSGETILELMNSKTYTNAMLDNIGGNIAQKPSTVYMPYQWTGSNHTLSYDELKTAYSPGQGPKLSFTMTPGKNHPMSNGQNNAGGYNSCDEGKACVNTPLELNEQLLKNLDNASTPEEIQVSLLMLTTTIAHEYLESFGDHSTEYQKKSPNGPVKAYFGADIAVQQIYNGYEPTFSNGKEVAEKVINETKDKSIIPKVTKVEKPK